MYSVGENRACQANEEEKEEYREINGNEEIKIKRDDGCHSREKRGRRAEKKGEYYDYGIFAP